MEWTMVQISLHDKLNSLVAKLPNFFGQMSIEGGRGSQPSFVMQTPCPFWAAQTDILGAP